MLPSSVRIAAATLLLCAAGAAPGDERWVIERVAGTGQPADNGAEGPALETNIGMPFGVEFGPDGALYITEVQHHRVRRLDIKRNMLTTVAGNGKKGYAGDGGAALDASLNEPYEVRFDSAGDMYFVEMQNHLVRKVETKTGRILTIAGIGKPGFAGDGGPALKAQFKQPHSIALDNRGSLFVADIGNHRIRRIDLKSGLIETIAGTGERTLPVDGQVVKGKPMAGPRALFIVDRQMWIALREGHSVWRLDLDSSIARHIAGTGKAGYGGGSSSEAAKATFNGPKGIAVGSDGSIYVVDTENQVIRKIDPVASTVVTIAGSGPQNRGFAGDGGPANLAKLGRPHGIGVGPDGSVYVGDTDNHCVRRIRRVAE